MAQFETVIPAKRARLFNSVLWDVLARMLGCSVPVQVVRGEPDAAAEPLEERAADNREQVGAARR